MRVKKIRVESRFVLQGEQHLLSLVGNHPEDARKAKKKKDFSIICETSITFFKQKMLIESHLNQKFDNLMHCVFFFQFFKKIYYQ